MAMSQQASDAITWSIGFIAVCAFLVGLVYFVSIGLTKAQELGRDKMIACVDAGGTWLRDDCIAPQEAG